jgi:glutamate carboxypeptidase
VARATVSGRRHERPDRPGRLERLARLRVREAAMVDALGTLVEIESPSSDADGLAKCAVAVAALLEERLGRPPVAEGAHLHWSSGRPPVVVVIGHFDTVWPLGTLARRPFSLAEGVARGPGALDMKAGIVQLVEALAALGDAGGVDVVLTADEEVGSRTSRALVERVARGARAALVLEPSARGGALKTARKGTGDYILRVQGRAAHAGNEPERGANALVAVARAVLAAGRLARPELGTTVTPTLASAGSASNVVPAEASAHLDVRATGTEEAARLDRELRGLTAGVPGTTLAVDGGWNRPPMPASASAALFARAQACAARLGLEPLTGAAVGGGSDGNFTAAIGVPTLDGLGGVGGGMHAEDEHVLVRTMPERAALLAELIDEIRLG